MIQVNARHYRRPSEPTVVVCLDGSSFDYIEAVIAAGDAPFLASIVGAGQYRLVDSAMPSFTNPNNTSIVTGVPPAVHGISGNYFLSPDTGQPVMMNDPSFLRADTILAGFARARSSVAVVTAKDKLRLLLGAGLAEECASAEREGVPVYSAALSERVLERGVALLRSRRPELMYLSTSDYVQHTYAPGSPEANRFYRAIDRQLAAIDATEARLVVTADHGMQPKTDAAGRPRIVFLQDLLDDRLGADTTQVILPITDPYVAHHGALGGFATIYVRNPPSAGTVMRHLEDVIGLSEVLPRDEACARFELPPDRLGDLVVLGDRDHVVGTRPSEHDLSALHGPLRSHGSLFESRVPLLFNRPLKLDPAMRLRNYDAFWIALNAD